MPESGRWHSWLELRPVLGVRVPAGCMLGLDLRLELEQPVEHVLRPRGTTRNVDIDRHDRVDSHDGRVVVVEAAGARADAERDDPLGLGHLVVDALQHRRYLVADGTDYEEHVRLARRESRQAGAEAVDVVMSACGGHVLHPTASRHEWILEDGELPRPADGLVEAAGHESRVARHLTASQERHCPTRKRTLP